MGKVWKTGYKVVCRNRRHRYLHSSNFDKKDSGAFVIYEENKITEPKKGSQGPLCVFSDIHYALNYKTWLGHRLEIWRCLYEPSSSKSVWFKDPYFTKLKRTDITEVKFPQGTKLARRVILMTRITRGGREVKTRDE